MWYLTPRAGTFTVLVKTRNSEDYLQVCKGLIKRLSVVKDVIKGRMLGRFIFIDDRTFSSDI